MRCGILSTQTGPLSRAPSVCLPPIPPWLVNTKRSVMAGLLAELSLAPSGYLHRGPLTAQSTTGCIDPSHLPGPAASLTRCATSSRGFSREGMEVFTPSGHWCKQKQGKWGRKQRNIKLWTMARYGRTGHGQAKLGQNSRLQSAVHAGKQRVHGWLTKKGIKFVQMLDTIAFRINTKELGLTEE